VPEQEPRTTRALNLIGALLGLIYLLWVMWSMTPESTRTEWRLKITLSCAQVMRALGRHAAGASLSREATTGQANYQVPYLLMVTSERLMAAYERMTL
jgi:hypothetical protein